MKNEIILSEKEVYALLCDYYDVQVEIEHEIVEDIITGADAEDGGADHEYIIKNIKTGKFYRGHYTDWDLDNTDFDEEDQEFSRCDLYTKFTEVKPVEVTVVQYVNV